MSILNDVINTALRDHDISQVGGAGSSRLVDALRSLLAPKSSEAGTPPDQAHVEPDALQQLISHFEQSGYADIIRSWIGNGQNQPIEPHQLKEALGSQKVEELSRETGLPHNALLDALVRLLPTVIDRLTPQGRLTEPTHTESHG
jgi:uncharacterized protein YidB (DUF937 family)